MSISKQVEDERLRAEMFDENDDSELPPPRPDYDYDDDDYECNGVNCPPRAHDHKVLL